MNSPSPLIPQGSNLEQQNQARSSLKVKIFCAIGVNVAVLLVLLMQGCKREQPAVENPPVDQAAVYDGTNPPPVYDGTNPPPVVDAGGSNVAPAVIEHAPVPPPATSTVVPPVTSASEYKIEKGDSFYTIGKKFGVSAKAIQAANPNVDPAKLQIGKTIQIPAATVAAPPAVASGAPVVDTASGEITITVKSGDTLGKIATEHHTTVKAIQAANGLKDTRIKVGEKLKIPAK